MIDQAPRPLREVQEPPCHLVCREHRRHWKLGHPWEYRWHRIPAWGKAMLVRLGPGCETVGKSASVAYRLRTDDAGGPHRGRYQYLDSTWARTVPYLPTRHLRRVATRGPAYLASPREQDVRTFFFFPSHRSEWQCHA